MNPLVKQNEIKSFSIICLTFINEQPYYNQVIAPDSTYTCILSK